MTEPVLRFKLTGEQVRYLTKSSMPGDLLNGLTIKNGSFIEGTRSAVERLRDRLTELMATVGFDQDYSPTAEGKVIEQIIDVLFVP